jgi:hypothetical protein
MKSMHLPCPSRICVSLGLPGLVTKTKRVCEIARRKTPDAMEIEGSRRIPL